MAKERQFMRVQILRRENEGQDIVVPDERGIDWKIRDGAKVSVPAHIVNALKSATTMRHIHNFDTHEKKIVPVTRYMIRELSPGEKLDTETDDVDAMAEALGDESEERISKQAQNLAKHREDRKRKKVG